MCASHTEFRQLITEGRLLADLRAIVVDECHCIEEWGKGFREEYREIGKIRSLAPQAVPILATTATLTPTALEATARALEINLHTSFYLNLGNRRPNIDQYLNWIDSTEDYRTFEKFFNQRTYTKPEDLGKVLIFVDKRLLAQRVAYYIQSILPVWARQYVDYYHGSRTPDAKNRVMQEFVRGQKRIIVATEALGMVSATVQIAFTMRTHSI